MSEVRFSGPPAPTQRRKTKPARAGRAPALKGCVEPRLFTPPLRTLTRRTTRGFEVIEFAANVLGEPLLPWQEWFVKHALEINPDGSPRFRVIVLLVARQNGKTHVKKAMNLWRLFVDDARLILGVAQDLSLAREIWTACVDTIHEVPDLKSEFATHRKTNGDEQFILQNGARYKISAATRSAGRGLSVDVLDFEELREQRSWDAWSALSKTTSARPHGQVVCASNAGDDQSVVLNLLRERALSGADPGIGLFEWSAADGCELDDPDGWCQANPALGHTLSEASIRTSLGTDPAAVFRTEVLCQRVDVLDGAIDTAAWKDCRDATGTLASVRDTVVACLDVSPDSGHVTLAGAALLPDGRVRVESFAAWTSTEAARRALPGLLERIRPRALAWFPGGPAAGMAADLRALEIAVEVSGSAVGEACMEFADLVTARRVLQPSDPLLDTHVANASKFHTGDGWRFARRNAVGHVDALYAIAGAAHVARTVPVAKPRQPPMVV